VYLTPHWLDAGDRFWYDRQLADGSELVLVDPENRFTEKLADVRAGRRCPRVGCVRPMAGGT
jgi:hypothetical protein